MLIRNPGKKGSDVGFTWGPIESRSMKHTWGWTHLRISAVYGSGGFEYDLFRPRLKLGKQGEKVISISGSG